MPLPSLRSFPPPVTSTALLHLLAHPAVHPEKSDADTELLLSQPGYFLIRTLPSSASLVLSMRVEKSVANFDVTIEQEPAPFTLVLSALRFATVEKLIERAMTEGFTYRGEQLIMERCLQREYGREVPFGHWEGTRLIPRACKSRFSEDSRLPCALLAPSSKVSCALSDEELEELVKMKHDGILHLDDYTRLSKDALLLKFAPFEISLGAYMRAHPDTSILQRLAWLTKTISALTFLMNHNPACSVLLTGETLVLQDADSLQLKLVHLGTQLDPSDHWRWMAPETHSSPSSPASVVWQFAVLLWQTFTGFSPLPFGSYLTAESFLSAGASLPQPSSACPFLVLPHSLTPEQAATPTMKRYQPSYGTMARFPAAPACIVTLFSSCLKFAPAESRATWSTISGVFQAEYRIARCAKILDKFIP
ncbi:hypothetical protein PRIPAC_88664 [Pristionchus pacificus]|uniref:Uncharacterized protein n=1 Tax=Pristionchus pacificus TaxID=54126 RepID=A0A454XW75_PRIPA|nr:hypothetical protein PRIPAC_88664 [Pristionchus pacificus]|eukprot:PDM82997.1 hypothetical protein PRIPAC_37390 [Pristionchus pacificus]